MEISVDRGWKSIQRQRSELAQNVLFIKHEIYRTILLGDTKWISSLTGQTNYDFSKF